MLRRWFPALALFGWLVALAATAQDAPPAPLPEGIEVQARGPVHEAFASPTTDPVPTRVVPKAPPAAIDEVPPEQKPEGDVVWIGGYWAYDDDAADFMWVSGVWRKSPAGKSWVAGYWRPEGTGHQWVPGFWTVAKAAAQQDVTYLPSPPEVPPAAAPGTPPRADAFFVPGCWVWRGTAYAWRAGYWARMQDGYVWVPDHYRWSPGGYVFVEGYWDLALPRRGILYAPVVIRPSVIRAGFVYTPHYAVNDSVIVSAMFVRPSVTHYYFGDYYGPAYTNLGYESCVVYSRRRYEPVIVYETYYRRDPNWVSIQINLHNDRCAGRAPLPPRTLVQQNTIIQRNVTNVTNVTNVNMIAPPAQVAAARGQKMVALDKGTREAARAQAQSLSTVAAQRSQSEVKAPGGPPRMPRTASLAVPKAEPVRAGMNAPIQQTGAKLGTPTPKAAAVTVPTSNPKERPPTPMPKAAPEYRPMAKPPVPMPKAAPPKAQPKKDRDKKG